MPHSPENAPSSAEPTPFMLCDDCRNDKMDWLTYNQTPVKGWRQYPHNPARDAEIRSVYIEDRIALIRRQVALIERICRTQHQPNQQQSTSLEVGIA